ncbi:uncharacterized protein NPIL_266071 [Nephila pilipes]|uniref:Uncharacterized protein n=1 Tax=Nephila pilipes TaxID=299642 RepID=A0A8X6UDH3_NEPPI|nr:uncharacterized protein NPIL_266071 [Nephila pilipes]
MGHSHRMTVAIAAPFAHVTDTDASENKVVEVDNFDGFVLKKVLSELASEYDITVVKGNIWEAQQCNGTWSGIPGMIQRGEIDLAFTYLRTEGAIRKMYGISKSFAHFDITYAENVPKVHKPIAFSYPFDGNVWIGLIISLFIMSLLFLKLHDGRCSFGSAFFKIFGSILRQPFSFNNDSLKCYVLALVWWLFVTVITTAYCETFFSILFQSMKEIRKVHGFFEASPERENQFFFRKFCFSFLFNFTAGSEGAFAAKDNMYVNASKTISEHHPEADPYETLDRNLSTLFSENQEIAYVFNDSLLASPIAFVYGNRFCCISRLNLIFSGVTTVFKYDSSLKDNLVKRSLEFLEVSKDFNTRSLSFNDLYGIVIFFVLGIMFSFFVLVGEIVFYRMNSN